MTKTIVITSGKDGVGKTNIGLNAALEISQQNYRTCLFDADLGLASADIPPGIQPENNLDSFISGEKKLDEIILHPEGGIDIIPGSTDIEKITWSGENKISDLVASFSELEHYDYFIIDTSSGISKDLIAFCLATTETVLVITSEATSLTEAYLLLKIMSLNGYRGTVKTVVNKCPSIPISKRTYLRFEAVVSKSLDIKMTLIGTILNDWNIAKAAKEHKPLLTLYPNSIASQCIRAMVSTLVEDTAQEEGRTDLSEFWQNFFNFIQSDLLLTASLSEDNETEPSPPPKEPRAEKLSSLTKITPFSHSGGIINPLKLPSPVTLISKSLELQTRGEVSEDELLKIFSSDPVLMVRAMQMFRSSNPKRSNRITRISQIFEDLGTEALSSLLTTTSLHRALNDHLAPDNLFLNTFWYHSYKSALLAKLIAEATDYPYPEEAFLAGLIHDIGRLALQTEYPQVYAQIPYTSRDQKTALQTETQVFGQNHAEIGAEALRAFQLNGPIVDAVQYHTESESRIKTGFELVKIVYIASQTASSSLENMQHGFDLGESLLGLAPDKLRNGVETAQKVLTQIADHFRIQHAADMENSDSDKIEAYLKIQAADYAVLQSAMPTSTAVKEPPQVIRLIHQGLDILFGIKVSFCLMADKQRSSLQAVGYANCFGEEILSDIVIPLKSENSLIAEAFRTSEIKISANGKADSPFSLADEQIKSILDSQVLVCVPMITRRIAKGVIVFGIQQVELPHIHKQQKRLKEFGTRSASTLFDSEQFLKEKELQ